ncbi:MAG: cellulase family glycosylhydrolase [Rhodanobacteraceae bacterium]|nr:cellulase family glycosylhydrolase [Rhodanobacteraceae bacterium]
MGWWSSWGTTVYARTRPEGTWGATTAPPTASYLPRCSVADSPSRPLPLRGVNLAGAEFAVDSSGQGKLPGVFGFDYIYPDARYSPGYTTPAALLSRGMTTFRLPFRWERLQPQRGAALDPSEWGRLTVTVKGLTDKGAKVILDPHNYARYGRAVIGSAAVPNVHFADLWRRLAVAFKANPNVIFGLMNEPFDMPTEQWVRAANVAINAIRATGALNLVLVPGNGWSGAHSWADDWYGTPNARAMLAIVDPADTMAFEAHQYLDRDSSGTNPACVSATVGAERMRPFTEWLRAHKKKGFLGEFAGGDSPTCLAALDNLLAYLEANRDVYLGWTYWAAGPWWGSAWTSLEPRNGVDRPQMQVLARHLVATAEPPPVVPPPLPPPVPPPTTPAGTTYPTSLMAASVGGAADGGGWNLWSNGYLTVQHPFSAAPTTLTVRARGTALGGVWPRMVVSVGGRQVGSVDVTSAAWADYRFSYTPPAAAPAEVRIAFVNDAVSTREDRNLYVQHLVVGGATEPLPPPVEPPPPTTGVWRIMPLGDSITVGVNGGYRNGLWNRLKAAGYAVDFVGSESDIYTKAPDPNHEGHPGFTIGGIAERIDEWARAANPTHVLLMIGTNDVAWWSAKTASEIAEETMALVDRLRAVLPKAWIVVGSIPPLTVAIIEPHKVNRAVLARDYNASLKARVQERGLRGQRVRFADTGSVLSVTDLYDGVHPTEGAADKMAGVWFTALKPLSP